MRINVEDALFCLVDVQDKLYPHVTNKDEIEKNKTSVQSWYPGLNSLFCHFPFSISLVLKI